MHVYITYLLLMAVTTNSAAPSAVAPVNNIWWVVLGPSLIAAITAIIVAAINFKNNKKLKSDDKKSKVMEEYIHLYGRMFNLCRTFIENSSDISRVFVFYTENGGGIPKPGSMINSTTYIDVYPDKISKLPILNKTPVSGEMLTLLSKTISSEGVVVVIPNAVEHQTLVGEEFDAIYKAYNVKRSEFVFLRSFERRVFVMNIHYNEAEAPPAETTLKGLELKREIIGILNEMEEIYKLLAD